MPLFPNRPPHRPPGPRPSQRPQGGSRPPIDPGGSAKSNLMSMFQTDDGKLDFDKITGTGKQVMDLYSQVSPMITKFIKR
ncbi:YppG family protein [Virgibacillus salidurans]|uniref:YppG family protein n=1 Tax=Virgibacillus salidurans TaxID=2831673 RepID=UPI001F3F3D96|nr:YppG family protein [Virgibacillus sp. NKC19-16]